MDSQISEYAVQKSVIMDNDFKSKGGDYESGNSVLNNLQFTSKNNKGEEYTSNKKDGYINYLWRRGNDNNKDSQKIIEDNSKKNLINDLHQFNENSSNNKINLSNLLSNNSNISNIKSNNNKNNNSNNNQYNNTNKTDDMLSRNSAEDEGGISYLCSNNNTNISNLDIGVATNEVERFRKKYQQDTENSKNSKFNVDSNNLNSDVNTNQSEFMIYSNNNKSPSGDISGKLFN